MRIKLIAIITIVLFVLGIAIVLVYSYLQTLENRAKANVNEAPNSVEIVNLTDTSASIVWKTADTTTGKLNFYTTDTSPTVVLDDRDTVTSSNTNKRKIHFVTVKNLTASTKYSFSIYSNDKEYFNNTLKWNLTTLGTESSILTPKPIYGQANVDTGTNSEILIEMTAKTSTGDSLNLASLSTSSGTYSFDLSSLRTTSGDLVNLQVGDQLVINMTNESSKQAQIIANIK